MDEVSTTGSTYCAELKNGEIREFEITPEIIDIPKATLKQLAGGSPDENAYEINELLKGKKGPFNDIVTLNSAAALMATGNANSLKDAKEKVLASINEGKALSKLHALIEKSNS